MRTLHAVFAAAASLAAASCTKTNPDFCDDAHPCGEGFVCNTTTNACDEIGGEACTSSAECLDPLAPYCVPGADGLTCSAACDTNATCADVDPARPYCTDSAAAASVCGACVIDGSTGCAGTAPICDPAALDCRACAADDECASNVCLPSGACADPADVLYAAVNGAASACSQLAPCPLPEAVANIGTNGRTTIKLLLSDGPGFEIDDALVINDDVTIYATGATIDRNNGGTGAVIETDANVTIIGATITGGHGTSGIGHGVDCASGDLRLERITITDNGGVGVRGDSACTLTIAAATISHNDGGGIDSSGPLDLAASTIANNPGGGIAVTNGGASSRIVNNFIYGNGAAGAAGSTFGGIDYSGGASTIAFNSIVENFAKTGVSGGILCDESTLTASNNIVVENSGGAFGQENGLCNFADSIFAAGELFAGTSSNITTVAPTFINAAAQDYHLAAGSSGIDIGAAVAGITTDVDGDPRGATPDIGADEYVP